MMQVLSEPRSASIRPALRVVALLTVRNEALYLDSCLTHLITHGMEVCVIDNESTDKTVEIARQYLGKGVFRIETIGFNGKFELGKILENEERLSREIDADWFMHHDADEIREPPAPYKTLLEAIVDVDKQGYNAINFDEFIFIPTLGQPDVVPSDHVSDMRHYYFFEPFLQRQVKLWKSGHQKVDLRSSAGHRVKFPGRRIFPRPFILRHYIALSASHWIAKYETRKFSEQELARGWHITRLHMSKDTIRILPCKELVKLSSDKTFDRSRPYRHHPFLTSRLPIRHRVRNFLRRFLQRLMLAIYRSNQKCLSVRP